MSRVEPNDKEPERQSRDDERRQPAGRTPGKAEGDENTVDEALQRQDQDEPPKGD